MRRGSELTTEQRKKRAAATKEWRDNNVVRYADNLRRWRRNNPDRGILSGRRQRAKRLGLTLEQYLEILSRPCQVCFSTSRVVVDHDHSTGRIRGALCNLCNVALGAMRDNPELLRRLAYYVEDVT